ncbi:MAG: hypothetical protein H0W72_11360 [Planctomycetes bacterium]|nr:hypothetical protein [Planctomycetota bacterium]
MHLVKTLSALAIVGGFLPTAQALSIKDDVISLGVGVRLQTRLQINDGTDRVGDDYRIQSGTRNAANDDLDFSIHRARLYLNGKYGANWKFQLAFASDGIDAGTQVGATNGNNNRLAQVRYAWIERQFKINDDFSHAIHAGLDKPYQNPSDAAMSSSRDLFPNRNRAATFLAPRGVGIGYRLTAPIASLALDLQNNTSATKDVDNDAGSNNNEEGEGFYYGARVEFSILKDWFTTKRAESYAGKEGTALVIGASYGVNDGALVDATAAVVGPPVVAATVDRTVDTTAYGVDLLFHYHMITAYAEYRMMNVDTDNITGADTDIDSDVILAQLGYAFPLANDTVIEPCVRYQIIDLNTDNDDELAEFGANAESGTSGDQIDLGINYYLDGHSNKLQLAYSMWSAEEGDAEANIIRLQHQINF